tara:strand:- start:379 stop:1257 length:879 start_codon:yes stop_codon:yes gene_type:complete
MTIAKSLNHSNVTDTEIKNYYSLEPVKTTDEDYNFDKQLVKVINEYMKTQQKFSSDQAKRSFKSRLKKFIIDDKSSRGKVYDSFISWRMAQIQLHKSKVRDMRLQEGQQSISVDDKDKLISEQKEEIKELKRQLALLEVENAKLKKPVIEKLDYVATCVWPPDNAKLKEPVIEPVIQPVIKPVIKKVIKSKPNGGEGSVNVYLKIETDEQREEFYKNEIKLKSDELIDQFKHKYNCDSNAIDKLVDIYYQFIEIESTQCLDILDENDYEYDADELYDSVKDNFEEELKAISK